MQSPAGIKWVRLRFRSVNQYEDYHTLPMHADGFRGALPGRQCPPNRSRRSGISCICLEVMDNRGHGKIYPDLNQSTPYIVVRLAR